MTAAAFALLTQARRAGPGRYMARCPAHGDRSPSLSVREGKDGRILLHCFAGCEKAAVLHAIGLTWRDLFNDAPFDPRARAEALRLKDERDAEAREKAKGERRASGIYRRLVCVVDALGSRLARLPDGGEAAALAGVFHSACRWLQEVEVSLGIGPEVPIAGAAKPMTCSPFTEPDPERLEAAKVRTEAQLRCYVGTGQAGPVLAMKPERERPSLWRWIPTRPSDRAIGSALYEAALDTLEYLEALGGMGFPQTNESPVASGALKGAA